MDNFTHSLFGYALARAVPSAKHTAPSPARRRALVYSSVIASNIPDADFLVRFVADDRKLAYLVHHRGHTHTLLFALPLGFVVGWLCARLARASPDDRKAAVLLGGLAGLLHVALDACNNYGVHPFFPLDNRWYYGDAVFIVEPLVWFSLLPLLVLHAHTRWGKALGALIAIAAWILIIRVDAFRLAGVLALAVVFGLMLFWQHRAGPTAWPALGAVVGIAVVFFLASQVSEAKLRAELTRQRPDETILDVVTTPFPATPACWMAITLSQDPHGTYHARGAQLSLTPSLIDASTCTLDRGQGHAAPLRPSDLSNRADVRWKLVFSAPAEELRTLARDDCRAAAALRFVRAPYWMQHAGTPVLGDLRYHGGEGLGFADIELSDRPCRDFIPDWVPPRQDLLR